MCRKCKRWHSPHEMLSFSCGHTVRVGQSTLPSAGRGVFTIKAFKAFEPITYYDGRRMRNYQNGNSDYAFEFTTPCGFQQLVGISKLSLRLNSWHGRGVAQLINDPICYEHSGHNVNCFFQGSTGGRLYVVSLRDIEPGEELFVSYGMQYWTKRRVKRLGESADYYANCHSILDDVLLPTVLKHGHIVDCVHADTTFKCRCIKLKPVCSAHTPECHGSRYHTITASISCTYLETKCDACNETQTIPCFDDDDGDAEHNENEVVD